MLVEVEVEEDQLWWRKCLSGAGPWLRGWRMQAWEDDRCRFLLADEEMKGSGWLNFPWWMLGSLKAASLVSMSAISSEELFLCPQADIQT